ncbi:MAG: response regulator transcription factor [Proteobacteria bacterium]|nr:response regulator transcription factor [Pseudomonadota bacterium]
MNAFICSSNEDIRKRLLTILSDNKIDSRIFTSADELVEILPVSPIVNLIYHLGSNSCSESKLTIIQKQFKEKLNTLVLDNSPSPDQGVRLLNMNVRGYANSWIEANKLITALSVIEQGEIWAGAIIIKYLLQKSSEQKIINSTETSILNKLSEREQEIAKHIYAGKKNRDIAEELYISERTVKAHLTTIYKKLNIRNRLELSLILAEKHN